MRKVITILLVTAIVLYIAGDFEFSYERNEAGNHRIEVNYSLEIKGFSPGIVH